MSRRQKFNDYIHSGQCSKSFINSSEISELTNIFVDLVQAIKEPTARDYRIRNKYLVKESHSVKYLYEVVANLQSLFRVVSKELFFDLLENIHAEGGKHLGRDRLFAVLKQNYSCFSKEDINLFLNSCNEWQLQKYKKQLKNTITRPMRSSNFASRGQIDLIDFQNTPKINKPYNFFVVLLDHLPIFFSSSIAKQDC